ncbi:hypothetical protein JYU29_05700 [Tianweitania sp. BSSL-BM11]|uniref:Uncharacterized protein n=1 Tax=Tianweitania aestuarii TaxID=2814886 RepID=A0ABS5RT04_9HYPH|nr:hypothetical protein [Tianweitania aestuarii]MBS9720180.1 hypothetical protein [Tianweitania aestuarii]
MSWDSALAAADLAVARYFDTHDFVLIPMAKPDREVNAVASEDPGRKAFEFKGSIEADPELNEIGNNRNASSRSGGARNVARLCLTALTAAPVSLEDGTILPVWPWQPRQGDHIEQPGQRYVIAASPDRDGTDRLVLWLNKARS